MFQELTNNVFDKLTYGEFTFHVSRKFSVQWDEMLSGGAGFFSNFWSTWTAIHGYPPNYPISNETSHFDEIIIIPDQTR